MSGAQWLTFRWKRQPVAVDADTVSSVLDDAAVAPLPAPLDGFTQMVAWGSQLCPLAEDPHRDSESLEAILIFAESNPNLALRVYGSIELVRGEQAGAQLQLEDGRSIPLRDPDTWLAEQQGKGA